MMELEQFKAQYQARFERLSEQSAANLTAIIQRRSHTALERIRKNLLLDVSFSLVAVLLLGLGITIGSSAALRWLGLFTVIFGSCQVIVFAWQYRQLKIQLTPTIGSVRQHLGATLNQVRRFVRFYYQYCLWSIPVSFIAGALVGLTSEATDPAFVFFPKKMTITFFLVAVLVCAGLVIGVYFLLRWYVHQLYGRYLNELEACLQDLVDEQ